MSTETKTVKISEATREQLRTFAQQMLGMSFAANASTDKMIGQIRSAWDKDEIPVIAASGPTDQTGTPPAKPNGTRALRGDTSKNDPQVELTINEQEGPAGKRPVFVQVNGRGMLIPRNQRVTVGYRFFEALKNAVKTVHEQEEDGNISSRDVPSYPFQVHSMPSPAEIDAWLERTAKIVA